MRIAALAKALSSLRNLVDRACFRALEGKKGLSQRRLISVAKRGRSIETTNERNMAAKRILRLVVVVACFSAIAPTASAFSPPDEAYFPPNSSGSYPLGSRYYGAVDPNPIGYYPYAYYDGPAFPVRRAIGYYPYPDPHPYANPAPYPFAYWGYGAWPYGFPGWGWGTVYPYGFGF